MLGSLAHGTARRRPRLLAGVPSSTQVNATREHRPRVHSAALISFLHVCVHKDHFALVQHSAGGPRSARAARTAAVGGLRRILGSTHLRPLPQGWLFGRPSADLRSSTSFSPGSVNPVSIAAPECSSVCTSGRVCVALPEDGQQLRSSVRRNR